ncbi:MAG: hypothetical protein WBC98_03855 [Candidatus Zixiibacteriota bacterium]
MFGKKEVVVFCLVFLSLLVLCSKVPAQFDLSLSPLLVELELVPGAKKSFSLHLHNDSRTDPVTIKAYPGDMIQERMGAYAILEDEESKFSCADWINLNETFFTIAPGSTRVISAEVKAPRDVFGSRYAAVIFEVVPDKGSDEKKLASVQYHFKMPTFVEVTIRRFGGVVKKIDIVDFKAEAVTNPRLMQQVGKNTMSFTATVKNEGNMHVKASGSLLIRTKEGRLKRQVPLGTGRGIVLPGATLDFRSIVQKPTPGEYVAQAMIRYGSPSPAMAEAPFTVGTRSLASDTFQTASFLALQVKPEEIIQDIPAGGFRYVNLRFRSQEPESISVRGKIMAVEYDEEGNLVVVDPVEGDRSCIQWLNLKPLTFDLRPGGTKNVKLTISGPKGYSGGYYACLVFDASIKGAKETSLATLFQIPILLNLPKDVELNGEISGINISASRNSPATIQVLFKNTGNTHVKPSGKLVLKVRPKLALPEGIEYAGERKYEPVGESRFEQTDEFILPGGVRRMETSFQEKLSPGKYLAEVIINYGGNSVAKFEKEFRIK